MNAATIMLTVNAMTMPKATQIAISTARHARRRAIPLFHLRLTAGPSIPGSKSHACRAVKTGCQPATPA